MARDIDIVSERVRREVPDVVIERIRVAHAGADDDGLWFFRLPGIRREIQVESSIGDAPFTVEHDEMQSSQEAITGADVERTVSEVCAFLLSIRTER